MYKYILYLFLSFFFVIGCKNKLKKSSNSESLIYPEETYFTSMKQITFGGDNAEAYWSFDDQNIIFQSNNSNWGVSCDQLFVMQRNEVFDQFQPKMVSTGDGRATCAYFLPGNEYFIYASTHEFQNQCPETPLRVEGKYVWPIYNAYDIYKADMEGNIVAKLTDEPGYDAEATVSPKGDKIVFTSNRSGDLELYTMNIDGTEVTQITNELGYDGGAFFSPDGTKIVFRASRPKTKAEIDSYKTLLAEGLVQPSEMELFICDVDGSNLRQITFLGNANWSPFFHPSGKKILFSSNFEAILGFPFNLYLIDVDGKNLTRITHGETFDAFPVFSNDGKHLLFSSNRNNGGTRDTNLFLVEWKDN